MSEEAERKGGRGRKPRVVTIPKALLEMYQKGQITQERLAAACGVPVSHVQQQLYRLGIRRANRGRMPIDPARLRPELLERYQTGEWNQEQLAQACGFSVPTLLKLLRQLGVPRTRKGGRRPGQDALPGAAQEVRRKRRSRIRKGSRRPDRDVPPGAAQEVRRHRPHRIVFMYRRGWSRGEIARLLGISRQRVNQVLAAEKQPMAPDEGPACLSCRDRFARKRGLCATCYQRLQKTVRLGQTTWAALEQAGQALPVRTL